jgi:hypothetical protein
MEGALSHAELSKATTKAGTPSNSTPHFCADHASPYTQMPARLLLVGKNFNGCGRIAVVTTTQSKVQP